jgi:HSP20 family molecular chaperone IbpA
MAFREAMDRLFEDSYIRTGPRWQAAGEARCELPIDAYTTDEEIVFTIALPGIDPEEVEITLEGDTLSIKGEIKAYPSRKRSGQRRSRWSQSNRIRCGVYTSAWLVCRQGTRKSPSKEGLLMSMCRD